MASPSLDEQTAKAVLRQVEFYFSDSNLPLDSFLKKTISESEDDMVSLALICSFSKMREHLKLGNVKPEEVPEDTVKSVAETLRTSSSLRISEDGKKVGRSSELLKVDDLIEQLDTRTIAAAPLEYNIKREDIESFFTQYGKVNSVRLPRHVADRRLFSGTALIEFSTEEDAEKVLKQNLVYGGIELELKSKKDFDAERVKDAEKFGNSRSQTGASNKNSSEAEANYPKGLIVAFTLKNLSGGDSLEEDQNNDTVNAQKVDGEIHSSENAAEESELGEPGKVNQEKADEEGASEDKAEDTDDSEKPSEVTHKKYENKEEKSTAAAYKNDENVVLREDLKEIFQKFGNVKFIDFRIGEESGYVRFEEPEASQKARAAAVLAKEGGLIVKNFIATLEPVTGEAEREYWSLFRGGNQDKHREYRGKGYRGRGGKYNRGGKQGWSRENHGASGRPNKVHKIGAV